VTSDYSRNNAAHDNVPESQEEPVVRVGTLVALRRHLPSDRDAFIRWYGDEEIAKLLRHDQRPLPRLAARGYFETSILPLSARGTCWAIVDLATEKLIGTTALTEITPNRLSGLFRIVIGEKEFWGHGRGTEATRLVVEEGFERLGLRQVRLEVFRHNERARRTYLRVGFHEVGEHVEYVGPERNPLYVLSMELNREDYERMGSRATRSPRISASS
jgi:RimJ/RimL family protein N-acetyltransferase